MANKLKRPTRYFQYIDGEQKGHVVALKDMFEESGETFYEFDNGENVNMAFVSPMTASREVLKNKFLVEVKSPDPKYLWRFENVQCQRVDLGNQESVMAPPIEDYLHIDRKNKDESTGLFSLTEDSMEGKEKIVFPMVNDIDPMKITPLPEMDWFYDPNAPIEEEAPVKQEAPKQQVKAVPQIEIFEPEGEPGIDGAMQAVSEKKAEEILRRLKEENEEVAVRPMTEDEKAVSLLIKKTKKHATEVPVTITINLPSKSLFNIVCDEFNNGGDIFVNEVVKGVTHEQIIAALKEGLMSAYRDEQTTVTE